MIFLRKPTIQDEQQISAYKKAMLKNGDILHGAAFLEEFDDIAAWLAYLKQFEQAETVPENFSVAHTYLVLNDEKQLIGLTNIRLQLSNEMLQTVGGHIGYSIHPAERRQGYGKELLKATLTEARRLGVTDVLITCAADNIGSQKVIESNGGIFENEVMNTQGEPYRRYWVK